MQEGYWVFLANCHLACPWLATLRGLDNPRIHPRFRLFLSSMPDDKFPLNVLQRSIKMTTEPPQVTFIIFVKEKENWRFIYVTDLERRTLF